MNYEDVIKDFVKRTKKNLDEIDKLSKKGVKVYESTQLINSCLGLLIFPQQNYFDNIPKISLNELDKQGWPVPKIVGGFKQVEDLRQLIRYLRNAIAHFNIQFIGDCNNEISLLNVWNIDKGKMNWKAELSLSDLRKIVDKFSKLITQN